ncbi:glycosyltransferase [Pelagerythrobacter rhizovicinus]|uniref:Glycosyltransferase family 1 protein n=1 Tax=Pelagerythrobacter rhizovicinus TaxID=2268576 RepID=A0A4Q2KMP1_9SPHN|nr:glycosyltransferase [Pelagerythrobacter rhizovicinus]RXZ65779.1 glycosyltransferase family 1 protein [Pelagerythrobacter rhizovicinus]
MAKGYAAEEGGMQTYAEGVAEAYAEAGAEVTVFTQTALGPRHMRVGPVALVDVGRPKSPLMPLRLRAAMRRERARNGTPFLVHGTTWRTSILPMLAGLPYVTTFHGREFMYGGTRTRQLMRMVARRARAIVTVSGYSAAKLRARLGDDLPEPIVAWNGLGDSPADCTAQGSSAENDPPLIFSLCRLEPRKNISACVRALAELRDQGLPFRYIIGGRGPALAEVQQLVEDCALGDMVEVAGFMPAERVAALYAQADIFLHPQIEIDDGRDFEGFGIAIADAMVAETAVVLGKAGGAIELVDSGVNGIAVDGTDHEELREALRHLLAHPAERRAMAEAARAHALRTFRWDRHIALILRGLDADVSAAEVDWLPPARLGTPGYAGAAGYEPALVRPVE